MSMSKNAMIFRVKDALWKRLEALIPPVVGRGRRPASDKACFEAIVFILRTGCQYVHLPKEYPPKSTVHSAYKRWVERGILEKCGERSCLNMTIPVGWIGSG